MCLLCVCKLVGAERNRGATGSVWSPTDFRGTAMTDTDLPIFTGWPADGPAFLAELADDNTRAFWMENVHRYRSALLEPTRALAAALTEEFGPPRVFRPHIDRRYRPNADPYRTDTGITVAGPGGTPYAAVLSVQGLTVAGRLPGVRPRAAAPLPGGRRREPAGEALEEVLGALRRDDLVPGDVPALTGSAAGLPGRPSASRAAAPARPVRRPGVAGGRVAANGGAAGAGSPRRGGRRGRWPTGWTPTSDRGTNRWP